jgi:hypothetical protein
MKEKQNTAAVIKFHERRHPMKGILEYTVFKNGVPVETVKRENLIVNGAREQMARLVAGDFPGRNITKIAFGSNGAEPDVTDDVIQNAYEKNISNISFPTLGEVRFDWGLTVNEANGKAIYEFGLITADDTLFSRRIREGGKPILKENDISIVGQWTIIF